MLSVLSVLERQLGSSRVNWETSCMTVGEGSQARMEVLLEEADRIPLSCSSSSTSMTAVGSRYELNEFSRRFHWRTSQVSVGESLLSWWMLDAQLEDAESVSCVYSSSSTTWTEGVGSRYDHHSSTLYSPKSCAMCQ